MNSISAESISSFQSALVRQRIDTAVLTKTHEAAKAQGEAAIGLLESASETADAAATATSTSQGRRVDVTA